MNDMNRDDAVTDALRRLKEDDQAVSAAPSVEARLREEVRALGSRRQRHSWIVWLEIAAAAVVLAAVALSWFMGNRSAPPAEVVPVQVAVETATPFFPLFYGSVPAAQTHLVRMEVPRTALVRFGLTSVDAVDGVGGTVLADVLVGDDGLARAVRFIQRFKEQ